MGRRLQPRPRVPRGVSVLVAGVVLALQTPVVGVAPPAQPTLVSPADGAVAVGTSPELRVTVTDPDLDSMDVTFFGRAAQGPAPVDFTIVHLSDTQYYSQSYPQTFTAVTQWIHDNREAWNIRYVVESGDLVQTADQIYQWDNADASLSILETPILPEFPEGIPYGVTPGNHDVPLYRVWERMFSPHALYRRHIRDTLNEVYRFEGLTVVALDSTRPAKHASRMSRRRKARRFRTVRSERPRRFKSRRSAIRSETVIWSSRRSPKRRARSLASLR